MKKQLKNKKRYANGDVSFQGLITYTVKGIDFKEILNVNLINASIDYGKIRLDDGSTINSSNFHMDFNHTFQKYTFDKNGFLDIEDSSSRIGNYKVRIIEVNE